VADLKDFFNNSPPSSTFWGRVPKHILVNYLTLACTHVHELLHERLSDSVACLLNKLWQQHQKLEFKIHEAVRPFNEEMVRRGNEALEVGMKPILHAIPPTPEFCDKGEFESKLAKFGLLRLEQSSIFSWLPASWRSDESVVVEAQDLRQVENLLVESTLEVVAAIERSVACVIDQEVQSQLAEVKESASKWLQEAITTLEKEKYQKQHSNETCENRYAALQKNINFAKQYETIIQRTLQMAKSMLMHVN